MPATQPVAVPDAPTGPIVLYDGLCGFCDASVQWLLDHDREGVLRYAALQGETAAAVVARHPELPANLDSLVFVEVVDGVERVGWHSTGVLRICARLPAPWRWFAVFRWVPAFLRDAAYRLFARMRYLVWGRLESCRIPRPDERARFLP